MTNVKTAPAGKRAAIHVRHGIITGIESGFIELTGYDSGAVLGAELLHVLKTHLKLPSSSVESLMASGSATGYVFTATGEAVEVTVRSGLPEGACAVYLLEEEPGPRINDTVAVLEPLFRDDFMSVALYSVPDFRILKANLSYIGFVKAAGWSHDDVLGSPVGDSPALSARLTEVLKSAAETGRVINAEELKFTISSGQEVFRNYTVQPVYIGGALKYILEVSRDATDSIRARELLEKQTAEIKLQKEKLEAIFENISDPLLLIDKSGFYEMMNKAARDAFGGKDVLRKVGDISSSGVYSDFNDTIIPPDSGPGWRLLNGETLRHYHMIKKSDEKPHYFDVNGTPVFDEAGGFACGVLYCRDITENFHHEKQILESNRLLFRQAKLLDLSNEAILAWEPGGKIVYWNKGAEQMYGYERSEAVGSSPGQLLGTVHPEKAKDIWSTLELSGDWYGLLEHVTKEGKQISVASRQQLIVDENGGKIILETNRDVTERVKTEKALRESELNYRMASEGSGAGVFAYDFLQKKGHWSTQYRTIIGLSPDAELRAEFDFSKFTFVHPEDRNRLHTAINAAIDPAGSGSLDLDYRIIRSDGLIRWVHAKAQTFFAGQGSDSYPYLVAGAIVDITDEKMTVDEVRRISEELTHIIESTDDYIWSVDKNLKVVFCNTAARVHFKEYFGKDVDDVETIMDLLPQRMAASLREETRRDFIDDRVQFEIRTPIGGRIISYTINPVYLNDEFVEVTVFGKDITERLNKEREIIRLNASLEERVSERTAQLEQSVSDLRNISLVLSHDLKTAMRGIGLHASDILDERDVAGSAHKIKKINRELLAMVNGLMNYEKSSRSTIEKASVNIKKMIVSVFNELNAGIASEGLLEFETGLPLVIADRESLRHVVLNLLSNALKFTVPGRPPRIVVGCRAEDNGYVLYFKDNGIGFDNSYAEKIFGVFERLHSKNEYEGSGVGLAIVRNIIQRHGGRVWADSEPENGTTVYLFLPNDINEDDVCIKQ